MAPASASSSSARAIHSPPPRPFRYHDCGSLATIGRTYAVGAFGRVELSGLPAWLAWAGVHLAYLIGFRNRALVMFQWWWQYLTFQRGARLLISAIPVDVLEPLRTSASASDSDPEPLAEPGLRSA